jgi:hypothetical protein
MELMLLPSSDTPPAQPAIAARLTQPGKNAKLNQSRHTIVLTLGYGQ